jgi:hypothetical protein
MIISISGSIGSGKSAIAEHLAARGFAVVAFADALREEILARLPRTLRALHDLQVPAGGHVCCCRSWPYEDCVRQMLYRTKPLGVRELLQEYGSQVRRADDPDYWIRRWEFGIARATANVATPDCRFPNEAHAVRRLGGLLWKVERPGHTGSGHVSETALAHWFDWDAVLVNDGTLLDLHAQVDRLLHARLDAQADGAA